MVRIKKKDETKLYQVEVKLWSFHSYGGNKRKINFEIDESELHTRKVENWKKYWDEKKGIFTEDKLNKVLLETQKPSLNYPEPNALLCVWEAIHPGGDVKGDEFFTFPVTKPSTQIKGTDFNFEKVDIFSISTFLRNIAEKEKEISLELPLLNEKISHLYEIFNCLEKNNV